MTKLVLTLLITLTLGSTHVVSKEILDSPALLKIKKYIDDNIELATEENTQDEGGGFKIYWYSIGKLRLSQHLNEHEAIYMLDNQVIDIETGRHLVNYINAKKRELREKKEQEQKRSIEEVTKDVLEEIAAKL